jgi:hypothetical protein
VSVNETSFTIEIHAGPATWAKVSSTTNDVGFGTTVTVD